MPWAPTERDAWQLFHVYLPNATCQAPGGTAQPEIMQGNEFCDQFQNHSTAAVLRLILGKVRSNWWPLLLSNEGREVGGALGALPEDPDSGSGTYIWWLTTSCQKIQLQEI